MRNFLVWSKIVLLGATILLSACDKSTPVTAPKTSLPASDETTNNKLFNADIRDAKVLVFSKTKGWRHDSIPAGIAAIQKIATDNFFSVTATEDASVFNDTQLSTFNAIVFLNTSLDVLDDDQQIAMERFIQAGGGFVGIHAAADTEWEGDWFWYRRLVGGVFKNHPNEPSNVQIARLDVQDKHHLASEKLPDSFEIADEWYNYRDFYEFNKVLLTVDEKTYHGGEHGEFHPITWYHEFDGGRSFYTGLGHTIETFSQPQFLTMLLGGLRYAVGGKPKLDYSKSRPENNRFVKKTLIDNLNEPVNVSFFANGDALISERSGGAKLVDYQTGETRDVGKIDVAYHNFLELGLLGFAIDPNFERTNFIYATLNVEKENGQLYERLSRFKWAGGRIDNKTQEVLLEYPIDKNCCHTGGDLQFGHNGELFMSTGDNTNPHDQNGYSPIDFHLDIEKNDALRSSGNTQDLRGKILRIKPLEAGGYDIPKGNLFADEKAGRLEIYAMGTRNPYKITYDKKAAALFFGDIGPDAGEDSPLQGPRGYDEINRVTQAGNFGWPLFIGNNYAYMDYDYLTRKSEKMFNPIVPINNSPRNKGIKELPPVQRPLLWYPYGQSEQFPELGKGGRCAIVADVYHAEDHPSNEHRYPKYYDDKLFIVDFMRNWIKAVSFDEAGRVKTIDPFAPHISFALPIDARFAPDGTLYVLEYGMAWFKGNPDARLSRIEFVGSGNRPPIPKISIDRSQGAVPFSAVASAQESTDLDDDKLTFSWSLRPKDTKSEPVVLGNTDQQTITIPDAGEYILALTSKDSNGAVATVEQHIQVGNEPAKISIAIEGNQSFYWPNTKALKYDVSISDKEDGDIKADLQNVLIEFTQQKNSDNAPAAGHQIADVNDIANELIKANSCTSCHNMDVKVVGPSFKEIAARYKNDKNGLKHLVNKIAKGGNGAWGEINMPAFATLSEADRTALATYVLSVGDAKKTMPLTGELPFTLNPDLQKMVDSVDQPKNFASVKYELLVNYQDKGGEGIGPITAKKSLVFSPARFPVAPLLKKETASKFIEQDKFLNNETLKIPASGNWLTLHLSAYDLTHINQLRLGGWVTKQSTRWEFELRLGSDTGTVLATGEMTGKILDTYSRAALKLDAQDGVKDIYLAVRSAEKSTSELQLFDIAFDK